MTTLLITKNNETVNKMLVHKLIADNYFITSSLIAAKDFAKNFDVDKILIGLEMQSAENLNTIKMWPLTHLNKIIYLS